MEDPRDGWIIVTVLHMPEDKNWKCDVTKDGVTRVVYCYTPVQVGQTIRLLRA